VSHDPSEIIVIYLFDALCNKKHFLLMLRSVAQTVAHGVNNAKVMGLILRESKNKMNALDVSTKCVNVKRFNILCNIYI